MITGVGASHENISVENMRTLPCLPKWARVEALFKANSQKDKDAVSSGVCLETSAHLSLSVCLFVLFVFLSSFVVVSLPVAMREQFIFVGVNTSLGVNTLLFLPTPLNLPPSSTVGYINITR